MRLLVHAAAGGLAAVPAAAAELVISVEIPRLTVSEYHRPYVAVWLEGAGQTVTNLAVWYDVDMKGGEGTKWLKDLRTWWRRSGRELTMPADGVSGATRPPGTHRLAFAGDKGAVTGLPAGEYTLVVEAAREVGGRELLRVPFQWPPSGPAKADAKGESELAAVTIDLKP
ncbi:MAG: hypothetical protein JWQ36_2854 [Enterovirga sp.]|jgi:hypothetical protein|nr:hypothetical protein [Enterovirga sp.]